MRGLSVIGALAIVLLLWIIQTSKAENRACEEMYGVECKRAYLPVTMVTQP